jgi:hypothetical protein
MGSPFYRLSEKKVVHANFGGRGDIEELQGLIALQVVRFDFMD